MTLSEWTEKTLLIGYWQYLYTTQLTEQWLDVGRHSTGEWKPFKIVVMSIFI